MVNNELMHYGKKGQQWGRRLYQNRDGSLTALGRIRYGKKKKASDKSRDTEQTKDSVGKNKHFKKMTDAELKQKIQRLRLEKNYKDLNNELSPVTRNKAEKFIAKVLTDSSEKILTQVASHVMAEAVNKAAGKKIVYANNKK